MTTNIDQQNAGLDLIWFGVNHPPEVDGPTAVSQAQQLLRRQGFQVGDVDNQDSDGKGHSGAAIYVDPTFTKQLQEADEWSCKEGQLEVIANWSR